MKNYIANYEISVNGKIDIKEIEIQISSNGTPFDIAKKKVNEIGGKLISVYEAEYITETLNGKEYKTYV